MCSSWVSAAEWAPGHEGGQRGGGRGQRGGGRGQRGGGRATSGKGQAMEERTEKERAQWQREWPGAGAERMAEEGGEREAAGDGGEARSRKKAVISSSGGRGEQGPHQRGEVGSREGQKDGIKMPALGAEEARKEYPEEKLDREGGSWDEKHNGCLHACFW